MDLTNDIVQARENIRKKYTSLNRGHVEDVRDFAETFKPIIDPLKDLAKGKSSPDKDVVLPKSEKKSESFAKPYLSQVAKSAGKTDQKFGIRRDPTGDFLIGSEKVEIDGNDLIIGDERYEGTKGLFELLVRKKPKNYSNDDLDTFKRVMDRTSAHKIGYSPREKIAYDRTQKSKLIQKIFEGSGLFKTYRPNSSVDFKYYDDPNELVDRLRLIWASRESGSSAHDNEIIEILSELRELGLI